MTIHTPAALLQRALGDEGFAVFQSERGVNESYTLTPVQADAILRMTLASWSTWNRRSWPRAPQPAQRDRRIRPHPFRPAEHFGHHPRRPARVEAEARRSAPHRNQRRRDRRHRSGRPDHRRDHGGSISSHGYIKRTPASVYRSQRRGGKGLTGAKTEEEDPIQHCSSPARTPSALLSPIRARSTG